MTQRIYWVPHTACFLGCAHCHNCSSPSGVRSSRDLVDRIIAHLPGPESVYRLEDVLVGGGEALMRGMGTEHLVRAFRERFPRGPLEIQVYPGLDDVATVSQRLAIDDPLEFGQRPSHGLRSHAEIPVPPAGEPERSSPREVGLGL